MNSTLATPPAADVEALAKVLARVDWMDLWWQMTGDDWPVPDDFPGKFAQIVVERIGSSALLADVRREAAAKAWNEGHEARANHIGHNENPYRGSV